MIGARYGWDKNIATRHKPKYSEYEQDMATIVGLELEMTMAISGGHKAADNDKFKQHRETLKQLREKHNLKRRAQ
jgi:hypothetical protein